MTKLIARDDPQFFEQTSNKPYDRHHYKIVCKDQSFVVESWQEVQEYWWNRGRNAPVPPVIEVIDKPKKSKGFMTSKSNLAVLSMQWLLPKLPTQRPLQCRIIVFVHENSTKS